MAVVSAEVINPFLATTKTILSQVCFVDVNIAKPELRGAAFDEDSWVVSVGVTGDVRGHVWMGMTEKHALRIASKMCMTDVAEMDAMAQSAISELSNMIMGNVSTVLSNSGIDTDITPPTLSHGNVYFGSQKTKTLCVPMTFEEGGLDLYLALSNE